MSGEAKTVSELCRELLDSMRYQARVDLFESIFKNLEEVGFEETLVWMRSRHQFESNKLKARGKC